MGKVAELRRGALTRALARTLLVIAAACSPASSAPSTPSTPAASVAPDAFEARAVALVERARALEPAITPRLTALADELGGAMVKLDHRLKTVASTARKLRLTSGSARPAIDDALRYTMVLADEPPGHHVEAVVRALAALERDGHAVVRVKNYWPPDDNYSGVHAVLRATEGTRWELQFHTPSSLAVQHATRPLYEELRDSATPIARRRALFDAMTAAWRTVPIPTGILAPGALHPIAALAHRPRP